jgi:hypothetical protein
VKPILVSVTVALVGLLPVSCTHYPDMGNDQVLALVLRWLGSQSSGYVVVQPESTFNSTNWNPKDSHDFERWEEWVKQQFRLNKLDADAATELEFRLNREDKPLSIQSSPGNGYVIDYDRMFAYDFERVGWERLHALWPDVQAYAGVSVPAYDKKRGIVLVYVQYPLQGTMFALRYEDGALREEARIDLWYQ